MMYFIMKSVMSQLVRMIFFLFTQDYFVTLACYIGVVTGFPRLQSNLWGNRDDSTVLRLSRLLVFEPTVLIRNPIHKFNRPQGTVEFMVGVTGLLRHLGSSLCDRHTAVCLSPAVRTYFPVGSNLVHQKILKINAPNWGHSFLTWSE